MKVLMVDNYDSFTYNLVQYLGELGAEIETVRNDAVAVDDLLAREGARCRARDRAGRQAARVGIAVTRVLMIDNYDSFTYNLVQYLGELGAEIETVRNDRATVEELLERRPDRVVVSPGPCTPN